MDNLVTENPSFLYKAVNYLGQNENNHGVVNHVTNIDNVLENIKIPISENFPDEVTSITSENDRLSEDLFSDKDTRRDLRPRNAEESIHEAKNTLLHAKFTEWTNKLPPKATGIKTQHMSTVKHSATETTSSESEDSRVTGGGENSCYLRKNCSNNMATRNPDGTPILKRKDWKQIEGQSGRKISFKVKNASSYRRIANSNPKASIIINNNKVTELTRKFNEMIKEENSILHHPKFAKTVEKIQNNMYKSSTSNSSTLSLNTNIKYVLQRKHSDRRYRLKKRCSSYDDIDKFSSRESIIDKKVRRAISDNAQKKRGRRRMRHNSKSSNTHSEKSLDIVDGLDIVNHVTDETITTAAAKSSSPPRKVKEAIKKFETNMSDINTNTSCDVKYVQVSKTNKPALAVKPKLPEKKSCLTVTKNVVLRDGKPKIKTLKSNSLVSDQYQEVERENKPKQDLIDNIEINKKVRTESLYEKFKFKTNFTHRNKLQVVEIQQEVTDTTPTITDVIEKSNLGESASTDVLKDDNIQEINQNVTPNDSFLWRTSCHNLMKHEIGAPKIYEHIFMPSFNDVLKNTNTDISTPITGMYTEVNKQVEKVVPENKSVISLEDPSIPIESSDETLKVVNEDQNCILVNHAVIEDQNDYTLNTAGIGDHKHVNSTIKTDIEDDYEPLEPFQVEAVNDVLEKQVTTDSIEKPSRLSKINCPLPEIPKILEPPSTQHHQSDNIYQCLLEMRSHPEGDESSIHSYEFCDNSQLEERTRGDGDSDDGYEYCRSPNELIATSPEPDDPKESSIENVKPLPPKRNPVMMRKRGSASSSFDSADPIYERVVPSRPPKSKNLTSLPTGNRDSFASYPSYNEGENIYDSIKHPASISNCYESIPNTPRSVVKFKNENRLGQGVNKRLSFDTVSNISQSSEQKSNSIYGQRSIISYSGQEISFQVPNSETSVSEKSDRSDDWMDLSDHDEEKGNSKIVIVRDRGRGRKSPVSWAQKVRHQWTKSPATAPGKYKHVRVASTSTVFLKSCSKTKYYSTNDEYVKKLLSKEESRRRRDLSAQKKSLSEANIEYEELVFFKTLFNGDVDELQDAIVFLDGDSSDSGHFYESLEGAPEPRAVTPIEEDFDSFDSDSECDEIETQHYEKSPIYHQHPIEERSRSRVRLSLATEEGCGGEYGSAGGAVPSHLPSPPASTYTLTRFASAATKKMRQLKRNFTRRYTDALKPTTNATQNDWDTNKTDPTYNEYQNVQFCQKTAPSLIENITPENIDYYNNINAIKSPNEILTKTESIESPINGNAFINKSVLNDTKNIYSATNLHNSAVEYRKLSTPNMEGGKGKDSGTLSRKTYFSFKSRFRRSSSIAMDIHTDVPSALKITNSTFYLTDSIDGDSGFSNCSDSVHLAIGGSSETLQPLAPTRRRNKKTESGSDSTIYATSKQHPKYESSPNLTAYSTPVGEQSTPGRYQSSLGGHPSTHTPAKLRPKSRPLAPPPPPPTDLTALNAELKKLLPSLAKRDKRRSQTSWYAECGGIEGDVLPNGDKERKSGVSGASWYAEAGLYQVGASSSSGASSASSSSHHGLFMQEPLYQFYNAAKLESVCQEHSTDSDSEGYEEISSVRRRALEQAGQGGEVRATEDDIRASSNNKGPLGDDGGPRRSALELLSPPGPSRTLWCEIPEVINSPVLSSLSPNQKRLQEAKFELLTSEASYLNSLTVLEKHFMSHDAFKEQNVLNQTDREILFGSIMPVKRCAQNFMNDLERCWQNNILLDGLCELVQRHAEKHFGAYIKYCENQIFLVKALHNLKRHSAFHEALTVLESHPACQSLSLHSFLMLPMQRVTRLPLLMDAVLKKLEPADREYQACMDALATLNSFVSQCNEGARNMERKEELFRMSSQLDFPAHMNHYPDLSVSCNVDASGKAKRWLVRSGELTQLVWRDDQLKLTFGKKFHKNPLWLFLFTDVLIIAKKKSEESYLVVDYCQRSLIEMSSGDVMSQLHLKESPGKHAMLLTLLENHENKTVEMLMSCHSETDRQRWSSALVLPSSGNPEETLYEGWDCPQVAAAFAYRPHQPDELALQEGDVVNVHKKMADGWYYGERIRDGEVGWFPGNYSKEIASAHVRARNLRQRYRLLALSGTYLGQKKKMS